MIACAVAQLATDLNCREEDLLSDGMTFCVARENPGRRPFPREKSHFEMVSLGTGVVVSATEDLLPYLREQLDGKGRDEAFGMPFVCGHALCFLPRQGAELVRPEAEDAPPPTASLTFEFVERADIPRLYKLDGFHMALGYDPNHARPDVLAAVARCGDKVVGVAGASADCQQLWQVGIDVLPEFRHKRLARTLVVQLTQEIRRRGFVPYYCTSVANIPSQRVALSAGYVPGWIASYRGRFGDAATAPVN